MAKKEVRVLRSITMALDVVLPTAPLRRQCRTPNRFHRAVGSKVSGSNSPPRSPVRRARLKARQAHNLKVVGSNPTPATKKIQIKQVLAPGLPGFFMPR